MLGQFVAPDGRIKDQRLPDSASPAMSEAGPDDQVVRTAAPRLGTEVEPSGTASPPLPYLALVRDLPQPSPATARRRLAAPTPASARRAGPDPRTEPFPADRPAPAAAAAGPTRPVLASAPPASSPRRDLGGFLQDQGFELTSGILPEDGRMSVADWVPEEITSPSRLASGMDEATEVGLAPAPRPRSSIREQESPSSFFAEEFASDTEAILADSPTMESPRGSSQLDNAVRPSRSAEPAPTLASANSIAAGMTPASRTAQFFPLAIVDGEPVGAITLRDLGQQGQAIHLAALVELLKLRMPQAEFAKLNSAAAADSFVTLDQLRAAGITIQYDAAQDRLLIDAR